MVRTITIEVVGLERLLGKMRDEGSLLGEPVATAMEASAIKVQQLARQNAPSWRNLLRNSITYDLKGSPIPLVALIGPMRGPATQYATVMEFGRRAGAKQPPIAAIAPWARAHGLNPYLVARSIARKGIKGRFYMKRAAEAAEPFIRQYLDRAAKEIERRFAA